MNCNDPDAPFRRGSLIFQLRAATEHAAYDGLGDSMLRRRQRSFIDGRYIANEVSNLMADILLEVSYAVRGEHET